MRSSVLRLVPARRPVLREVQVSVCVLSRASKCCSAKGCAGKHQSALGDAGEPHRATGDAGEHHNVTGDTGEYHSATVTQVSTSRHLKQYTWQWLWYCADTKVVIISKENMTAFQTKTKTKLCNGRNNWVQRVWLVTTQGLFSQWKITVKLIWRYLRLKCISVSKCTLKS